MGHTDLRSQWTLMAPRRFAMTQVEAEDFTATISSAEEWVAVVVEDGRMIVTEAEVAIVRVREDADIDEPHMPLKSAPLVTSASGTFYTLHVSTRHI